MLASSRCDTFVFFVCAETSTMSDEKRLIKKLLNNYETVGVVGRPVLNQSQTIHVNYGLALIQILDLDEKNQVLTTNVWSRYVSTERLVSRVARGLRSGRESVRPSICPIVRQPLWRAAGLLLSAPRAEDIDRQRRAPARSSNGAAARHSAANAGSVMLTAEFARLNTDLYS